MSQSCVNSQNGIDKSCTENSDCSGGRFVKQLNVNYF